MQRLCDACTLWRVKHIVMCINSTILRYLKKNIIISLVDLHNIYNCLFKNYCYWQLAIDSTSSDLIDLISEVHLVPILFICIMKL